MTLSSLAAALSLAAVPPSLPSRADPAAEALRASGREALRALAVLAAGEPPVEEVQDAAARTADREVPEGAGFAGRTRAAALLPRISVEVRRDERSYRVVGLQASGEVDYRHLSPVSTVLVRAAWELGELIASRGELAAAAASEARARRRAEAVRQATALYYERRQAQLELHLSPPEDALERAEAELKVERLGAELDALTGGILSGRRR